MSCEEDLVKTREWSNLRNRLVHTQMDMSKEDAEKTVTEIQAFTKSLSAHEFAHGILND